MFKSHRGRRIVASSAQSEYFFAITWKLTASLAALKIQLGLKRLLCKRKLIFINIKFPKDDQSKIISARLVRLKSQSGMKFTS